MHQHFVSQRQIHPLAVGITKLLGWSFDKFPKIYASQQILKEIGVGAKAELCAQLLEWMDECGPQMMSVCLDAASIGEDKYEGISFCRKVQSEPFDPRQPRVYRRLALGLVDLVTGLDRWLPAKNVKKQAVEHAEEDFADETEELEAAATASASSSLGPGKKWKHEGEAPSV